jgi:DNA-binding response OmpR family regulator
MKTPWRILVIDDNRDLRDSLQLMLQQVGYDVETARDGQQAIEVQQKRPVRIVITDIFMPGKEGIETIEYFRQEWPQVKIVAMSGGGEVAKRGYLKVAAEIGADAALQKPFEPQVLFSILRGL